jgi:Domain of unknown function (DUF4349)
MRASPRTLALLLSTSLILVSGCSKNPNDAAAPGNETAATSTVDVAAKDAAAAGAAASEQAPGISSEMAPGVAFAYRYAFTLPADAISGMQRQHSDACRKLGPTQCRVTGMSYEQPGEGEVTARLDFLLAPDIAQQFGSDAVGLVEKAEGELANATVTGENAGAAIEMSQQNSAGLQAELARLEARLKAPGLSADERRELTQRFDALQQQLTGEKDLRRQKEASIATTPVNFAYNSTGLFNAGSNPFGTAAEASLGSMSKMLAVVVTLAGILLPWLLLVGVIALLVRMRAMKKSLSSLTAVPPTAAVTADPAAQ